MTAIKTTNVNGSIALNDKSQAEAILSMLGLPPSDAINAYYLQNIMHGGIQVPLSIPDSEPQS